VAAGAGEEPASGRGVPLFGQQHVDDLPVLSTARYRYRHRPATLTRSRHEPAVARGVPERAGGVGKQRSESLHPPVDRDVVDLDTALRQQLASAAGRDGGAVVDRASISIRDQQCRERYVAGRWYPILGWGQIAESGVG
jgi:hypothetical protein